MKQFNELHFNIHDYFDFKVSLHTSLNDLLENITKKLCLSKRSKCNLVGRKIETFNSNLFPLSERGFIFLILIPKLMIFSVPACGEFSSFVNELCGTKYFMHNSLIELQSSVKTIVFDSQSVFSTGRMAPSTGLQVALCPPCN